MVRWMGKSPNADAQIGSAALAYWKGERAMSIRLSRLATGMLVVAAVVAMSGRCWAIRKGLAPSKDEWGLKYDVAVSDADGDKLTVVFTFADEGRLKPFYSVDLIAFSKQTDGQGGRTYDVWLPIELKPTKDGKRRGAGADRKDFRPRQDSDHHPYGRRPATTVRRLVLRHSDRKVLE